MSTQTDTATSTSTELPSNGSVAQRHNGSTKGASSLSPAPPLKSSTKRRSYNHVFAIHAKAKASPLSQDSQESLSFVGLKNLMALMLVVSNLRLMIENFRKYGVLICFSCFDYRRQDVIYGSILYLLVPCHLFVAYIIELVAGKQAKSTIARMQKQKDESEASQRKFQAAWYLIALAHGLNATLNLIISTTVVYQRIHNPGIGFVVEMHAVIVWLKVCSYALTNRDLRHALITPNSNITVPDLYASCPYPNNISLKNLCYFWWAPTLVYQPVYPRTDRIRWSFVIKRALECVGLSIVIWIASAQYAAPLLLNSLEKMASLDVISILERLMKLSTVSLFCWLCGFYALFQSFLNGLAEILRFADRDFYSDWWNVYSIRTYWTSWNKPVYHFMKRHLYAPMVGRGVPVSLAQIMVFLFSGALHELLVGVPTHNVIGVAMLGMLFQIPLIALTDPLRNTNSYVGKVTGNVIFWLSFCLVGQPLAAMLYFFAWQAKYGNLSQMIKK